MSATMSWSGGMKTAIVRGMPYATVWYKNIIPRLIFGSPILDVSGSDRDKRLIVSLENGQTWILYSENPIRS